jgi:two-component system, LytTR family, response regulator
MNKKIQALIVDDEPLARRGINQLLAPHSDVVVIAEARNGREAVGAIRNLNPDLVFLDVQMPELDGLGVLNEIGAQQMPLVIFVTAYDEFAVSAFDAHAIDYLVKPIQEARFNEALERTRQHIFAAEAVALSQKYSSLLENKDLHPRRRILVPTSSGEILLDANEIDWIEADDYYAAVHVKGRRHLIRESLASLEERLDTQQFLRVHRSAIVNVERVRELRTENSGITNLILRDGAIVPISRRRRALVNERLRAFR